MENINYQSNNYMVLPVKVQNLEKPWEEILNILQKSVIRLLKQQKDFIWIKKH